MGNWNLSAPGYCAIVALVGGSSLPAAAAESPGATPPRQVEVIVVTAEKREENLQDAAVAAVVFNEETMARNSIDNIDDLEFATPSLTIATAGQSNQMNMRGIGKFDSGGTTTSAVATYRDGVGTVSGFFNQEPYYDIDTIEVLRGPQGTYVGENAAGGAIFVNTKDPVIGGGYDGFVQAGYGDYNAVDLTGAVNIPLSDTLAMRIAAKHESRDSFFDVFIDPAATIKHPNDPGEIDYKSVRVGLLYQPTDPLELLLKFDYNELDHGGHVYGNVPGFPTPVGPITGQPYGNLDDDDLYTVGNNFIGVLARDKMGRGIFEMNYDLADGGTVRWITGAQYINTHIRNDDDGSVDADVRQHIRPVFRVYTTEATYLSAEDQPIRFLGGLFYRREDLEFPRDDGFMIFTGPDPAALGLSIHWDTTRVTQAAYGQVAFDLAPTVELQAGLRYQHYKSWQDALLLNAGIPFLPRDDHYDESTITYKVALNWQATPDHFFYAFVATGNTTGGSSVVAGVPSFDNATSIDYEAGWKGTLFDGRVLTQFGGFYTIIDDYQAPFAAVLSQGPPLQLLSTFQNLDGETETYGLELQAQTQFGNLGIDFTAGWNHSELGDDLIFDPTLARLIETGGTQVPWAPEYTFNIGVQYDFNLGNDMVLTPRATYSWIDEQTVTATDRVINGVPVDRIFDHDLINLQLNLTAGAWRAQLYMTNADEEEYIQAHSGSGAHPDAYANEPRRYGLRLTYDFGAE